MNIHEPVELENGRISIDVRLVALGVGMAMQLLDIVTTRRALRMGAVERNPLARFAMDHIGNNGTDAVKLAIALGVGVWTYRSGDSLSLFAGISAAPVVNNLLQLLERAARTGGTD